MPVRKERVFEDGRKQINGRERRNEPITEIPRVSCTVGSVGNRRKSGSRKKYERFFVWRNGPGCAPVKEKSMIVRRSASDSRNMAVW